MAPRKRRTLRAQSRRTTGSQKRRRPTHDTKTGTRVKTRGGDASPSRGDTDASSASPHKRYRDNEASPGDMRYTDRYRPDAGDCYHPRGRIRSVIDHYSSRGHQYPPSPTDTAGRSTTQLSPEDPPEPENCTTTSRREPFALAFPAHVDRYVPAPLPSPDDPQAGRHTAGCRQPFALAFPAHVDRYVPAPLPSPALSRDDEIRIKGRARAENLARDGNSGCRDGGSARREGDATEEESGSISSFERPDAVPEWEAEMGGGSAAGDSQGSWGDAWEGAAVVSTEKDDGVERPRDRLVIEDIPILDGEMW